MILTFHEGACVRAQAGDTTLVFGPVSKKSKNFKPVNFSADVVLISFNHDDMNGSDDMRGRPRKDDAEGIVHGAGNQPFVINGPGEYEVKDMTAAGFPSGSTYGGEGLINTVYSVHFDNIHLMYLGALGDLDLPQEVTEMDSPDILFVPIGGNGALSPSEAQKLAVKLEPKIIIPILYDDKTLKQFLKEAGEESVKPVDKLTLKRKDLVDKEGDVVVLGA